MRDLVGYGGRPPKVDWPGGARLAVSVVVNFEEGAESSIEAGDPAAEQIGEVTTVIPPGVRDVGQEQLFAYGMRAGVWRVLDALARRDVKATFLMCGYAVERAPDIARQIVAAGHEPACHGWRWRPHADFTDRDAERASLVQCLDVTESATGIRPVGFYCRGSQSEFTRDVLIDLGFTYDSNALDDDLPYWTAAASGRPILAVPYALDTNDMKFCPRVRRLRDGRHRCAARGGARGGAQGVEPRLPPPHRGPARPHRRVHARARLPRRPRRRRVDRPAATRNQPERGRAARLGAQPGQHTARLVGHLTEQ